MARNLATRVDRVDAVDISTEMIAAGKALPGGDLPNLRWILGTAEDAPLDPPYGLVVAGESLHWMNWERVLPRFASVLMPGGMLAIARRDQPPPLWHDALSALIREHSAMYNYQDFDLIAELTVRGLFEEVGERATAPGTFVQPVVDYINSFHSMSSLSLERLTPDAAVDFDAKLRVILAPYAVDGAVPLQPYGHVVVGPTAEAGPVAVTSTSLLRDNHHELALSVSCLQHGVGTLHRLNRERANLGNRWCLDGSVLDQFCQRRKLARVHRPRLRRAKRPPHGCHDKVKGGRAVEQPVLVVFLRRVRVVAWPLDDGDDMSFDVDHITA